ncbi:cytochrome-c peroxidase [Agaribacterium haliotis]|uniref:cytochrome-c peroxidase n=1 Tax=Agaribacterium haliotis TaxID=2013869 RepID=UPI000BB54523|nr:cytochrome-c peroxidase [Agaribacterium haliotis]
MNSVKLTWTVLLISMAAVMRAHAYEPYAPLEKPKNIDEQKAELGKFLYFDPRLSKSGVISCNTCHNLSMGGTDNIKTSVGHNWQQGPINSPTVLNSSLNNSQFWDGRAADLKEQAGGPIENPKEMASNHELAISIINSMPQYRAMFKQAFGSDGVTIDRATTAIAEFEKTLITPNSRFDLWLKGDKSQLAAHELKGYELFKNSGCVACHSGMGLGGTSYQKLGVFAEYKTKSTAKGRMDVTGKEQDKNMFKVPLLRNIELTYPYFHDGEVATLEEAVNLMGKLQLNKEFTSEETANIVAFLKTLTGEQPKIVLPILPPSNNDTTPPQPFADS